MSLSKRLFYRDFSPILTVLYLPQHLRHLATEYSALGPENGLEHRKAEMVLFWIRDMHSSFLLLVQGCQARFQVCIPQMTFFVRSFVQREGRKEVNSEVPTTGIPVLVSIAPTPNRALGHHRPLQIKVSSAGRFCVPSETCGTRSSVGWWRRWWRYETCGEGLFTPEAKPNNRGEKWHQASPCSTTWRFRIF